MSHVTPYPSAGWRRRATAALAALALLLGGCAAMQAQNPDSALKPVRAAAIGSDAFQAYFDCLMPGNQFWADRAAVLLVSLARNACTRQCDGCGDR